MIAPARRWEDLVAAFEWRVPEEFNFGALIDAWATDRSRLALHWEDESGRSERWTFWDVRQASNRAMNALGAHHSGSPPPIRSPTAPGIVSHRVSNAKGSSRPSSRCGPGPNSSPATPSACGWKPLAHPW